MDTGSVILVGILIAYPFIVSLVRALTQTTLNRTMPTQYLITYKGSDGKASELVFSTKDVNQVTKALRTIEEASGVATNTIIDDSSRHEAIIDDSSRHKAIGSHAR